MREYWQNFEVELVNYQNKTRLIKGWDDLFNKLKEHQNSLAAMKLSPYYKQFEEVCTNKFGLGFAADKYFLLNGLCMTVVHEIYFFINDFLFRTLSRGKTN